MYSQIFSEGSVYAAVNKNPHERILNYRLFESSSTVLFLSIFYLNKRRLLINGERWELYFCWFFYFDLVFYHYDLRMYR